MQNDYINNIKILLIEDELEVLNDLKKLLQIKYPIIQTACNGEEGYKKYLEFSPDIVITDIQMPIMDGLQMSELIKKENKDAQIIIVSAFNESKYLKKAINLGISKYVTKPLNGLLLFNNIDEIATNLYNAAQVKKANLKVLQQKKRAEALQHIANESNKTKSMFLANMSHEIRTPLNAIQGFIDVLIEEEQDERKLSHLDIVHRNGQSLLQIINDILDFSKIESGKLDIDKQEYNLYEQIDNVASLFCAKANEKEIIFSVYIEPNIPKIFNSDDLRIRQIISNLLSNAIKFTDKNGVVNLDVTSDVENQIIKFSVKDSGRGISQEYLKTIFDSFSQEDNTITKTFGGTGLGLAISHKLADMLGGELKVESEFGVGSEFFFELPTQNLKTVSEIYTKQILLDASDFKVAIVYPEYLKVKIDTVMEYLKAFKIKQIDEFSSIDKLNKSDDKYNIIFICASQLDEKYEKDLKDLDAKIIVLKDKLNTTTTNHKFIELICPLTASRLFDSMVGNISTIQHKKNILQDVDFKEKKVLLVEDNLSNQQFMSIVLKKLGFTFDIASDGIEAIEQFKINKYDVILMDENMPNMGGVEATQKILEIEKTNSLKHTPIIALTANALLGDRERFMEAGMDEYLTKPLNRKKLVDILSGLLN